MIPLLSMSDQAVSSLCSSDDLQTKTQVQPQVHQAAQDKVAAH